MTKMLYRTEVGVLLPKNDPEFEMYNDVYTGDYGFFDQDVSVFASFEEAKAWGNNCIKSGDDMTYAVITWDWYKPDKVEESLIKEILTGETPLDKSWNFGFTKEDMMYFAFKSEGEIRVPINKAA